MTASTPKTTDTASLARDGRPKAPTDSWATSRIVRRIATPPAAIYNWLSGPATTQQERSRAELAEVKNSLYRKGPIV